MPKYKLYNDDCLKVLPTLPQVDCIFADPPDNIGLGYDTYDDKVRDDEYITFLSSVLTLSILRAKVVWFSFNAKWTFEVGHIFSNLIYQYAASPRKLLGKPCVQVFTFGQHNKNDLGNNHRPLWRLMWDDAPLYPDAVKVPSWRERNGDKRAKPGGRVPGDVFDMQYKSWLLETLAEEPQRSGPTQVEINPWFYHCGDVFDFPRVTGNSKQRCDWHPTQLHEELVERCIRLTTKEGDHVLDPFGGTGTTLRVCKKISRDCTLIEMDPGYCLKLRELHPELKLNKIAA